jgi:glucosamine--fructose-6-phosphate aminotransferase (isomerizing)
MLKEIYEQPEVIRTSIATYLDAESADPSRSPFAISLSHLFLTELAQIHILACGTSWHAGMAAQYWFEQLAAIPTRLSSASEAIVAPLPITPNTVTIAVTQSGETADTIAAVNAEKARLRQYPADRQLQLIGITNQAESSLTRLVDRSLLTLAGPEIGVAATKTFTAQLLVFLYLAIDVAVQRQTLPVQELQQLLAGLRSLPDQIELTIQRLEPVIQKLATSLMAAKHCIILGSGINRAIALEGALKLKETTYLHAEGYAAGEFLHGPIALLDPEITVIAIAPSGATQEIVLTTARIAKTHGTPVISITDGDRLEDCDRQIILPSVDERLSPFLTVLPFQLLAYHLAVARDLNVDCPRNITKTIL